MTYKNKIAIIIAISILILSLCACGNKSQDQEVSAIEQGSINAFGVIDTEHTSSEMNTATTSPSESSGELHENDIGEEDNPLHEAVVRAEDSDMAPSESNIKLLDLTSLGIDNQTGYAQLTKYVDIVDVDNGFLARCYNGVLSNTSLNMMGFGIDYSKLEGSNIKALSFEFIRGVIDPLIGRSTNYHFAKWETTSGEIGEAETENDAHLVDVKCGYEYYDNLIQVYYRYNNSEYFKVTIELPQLDSEIGVEDVKGLIKNYVNVVFGTFNNTFESGRVQLRSYNGKVLFYVQLGEYDKDYNVQYLECDDTSVSRNDIFDYTAYKEYCDTLGIEAVYNNENLDYAVVTFYKGYGVEAVLADLVYNQESKNIIAYIRSGHDSEATEGNNTYCLVVPIEKSLQVRSVSVMSCISEEGYNSIVSDTGYALDQVHSALNPEKTEENPNTTNESDVEVVESEESENTEEAAE